MIVYKWVIKENNYYKPIVNNGAYKPANNIKLEYYKKGKTIKNFVDIHKILNNNTKYMNHFHRSGFHFWKNSNYWEIERYQRCMLKDTKKQTNCTLKCYIREKDIILQDDNRIIAKQFKILGEINEIR